MFSGKSVFYQKKSGNVQLFIRVFPPGVASCIVLKEIKSIDNSTDLSHRNVIVYTIPDWGAFESSDTSRLVVELV